MALTFDQFLVCDADVAHATGTTRRGAHPAARVLLVALIGVANFGLWSQLARIADNAPLFNYHSDNKYWDSLRGS